MPRLRLLRALALAAGVIMLAGCRLDLDVTVDTAEDGTGTVTVAATADAELVARAPAAVQELRMEDAAAAGWTVSGPLPVDGGGSQVVLTKPFSTPEEASAILAEVNGPNGPLRGLSLTQTREFARVTTDLSGEVRLDGGVAAFADDALVQVAGGVPLANQVAETGVPLDQSLGLTVTLNAPGEITETNGDADEGRATWTPSLADGVSTPLRATALADDVAALRARDIERWTVWALVGWGVLFGLIVVTVAWSRRRTGRPG